MEKTYQVYRRLDNEREGLDWAVRHNGEQLKVRYGPTGEETRQFSIPSRLCKDGKPWKERGEHTRQRLRDGYVSIGVGRFPSARLELVERARSDSLALHWETVQPLTRRRVSELMADVHEAASPDWLSAGAYPRRAQRRAEAGPAVGIASLEARAAAGRAVGRARPERYRKSVAG